MADDALLDLDSRRRIFRHIEDHPGLHLRGLQRSIGMPLGTIEYHLHQMEKAGLIVSRDDGRFKAFFAKEGLDRRDKDILYYVRQEMPRQIVIRLLMSPGLSHAELTSSLPVSASTCSFHLKKLVKAEIVAEERVGRAKRFTVCETERVAAVLVRYRRSFLDDLVDRFARAWLDLGHGAMSAEGGARDEQWLGDDTVETELVDDGGQRAGDDGTKEPTQDPEATASRADGNGRRPPSGGAVAPGPEEASAPKPAKTRPRRSGLALLLHWVAQAARGTAPDPARRPG